MGLRMNVKTIICMVILLGSVLPAARGATDADNDAEQVSLSFGIVPQQAPSKLLRSWAPVLKYLKRRTGIRFVFRTAPDIPTFEERVAAGEYDFAYMNPYHFTAFNQGKHGFQAVAKATDKRIRGILVVRKDSPINSLEDLWGETLAFPAPAAFAASVLPRAHLEAAKIAFVAQYVSSHDSVYRAVAGDFFPAGGGVLRTLEATDPEVRARLRVLWTSPPHTPHAIAAHPRVDDAIVDRVRLALVAINTDRDGRVALELLKLKGFEVARNSDWDDVRALNINAGLGRTK